ncbi:MAG: threonine synthase [Ktedonobacteraceae bacterium]|nr:threonine synthase [Ktedonobacteraceae bacterium]MBO0791070.1 threonine synthase [Ktedonobacteraceae bacterium]
MAFQFICSICHQKYDPASLVWRCSCGGVLDVAPFPVHFSLETTQKRFAGLWRYREALPFDSSFTDWQQITMGEGSTPLLAAGAALPSVFLKVEYLMPTSSYKDRGAVVLMAKARELGVRRVVCDSSGNAGVALAAYATRAGIDCEVYVPASASAKKLKQMAEHGATVHSIQGTREDAAKAAIAVVEQENLFYASHIYNPFFFQGTKTYAFEIWEQFEGRVPDLLVVPVGNGTLVLGPYYGFQDLLAAGLIKTMPRILAVQAENCAPLARAFREGAEVAQPVVNEGTIAEGIAIAAPARNRQILAAIRESQGAIITVAEADIVAAHRELARSGLYVEPTAAVAYAGLSTYLRQADDPELSIRREPFRQGTQTAVVALTGSGLKASPESILTRPCDHDN